ncbi:21167_t:CDS:2, partial [Cetraspora pellucida]
MTSRGSVVTREQHGDSFLDDVISRFRRDVDRAFSDLWGDTNRSSTTGTRLGDGVWAPRVDAELPGIPKDNVCVDIRGDNVIVSGENKPDDTYNTGTAWTQERRFGRFMRTIPLSVK